VAVVGARVTSAPRRGPLVRGPLAGHPEVVPFAVAAAAWLAVVVTGHPAGDGHAAAGAWREPGAAAVMVVAMTGPFAVPGVRTVAFTALWWHRGRAVATYTAAFFAAWLGMAAGLAAASAALAWAIPAGTAACLLLGGAAVAPFDPERRRWLGECHRPPRIRVHPRDALRDRLRAGGTDAARCARLCAPSMLAMLVLPAGPALPAVMAALTALALVERMSDGRRRRLVTAGHAALAVVVVGV
jgi:hypothetical protein